MKRMLVLVSIFGVSLILLFALTRSGSAADKAAATVSNPFAGDKTAVKAGEKVFDDRCQDCHGGDATGGAGPNLTDDTWIYGGSDAEVFATVAGGRKGGMPSWKGTLTDEEIWKVISYIRSLHR